MRGRGPSVTLAHVPSYPPSVGPERSVRARGTTACVATRAVLGAYLDGEALADSMMGDEVEVHLAECARCGALARQLRAQRVALAALASRQASDAEHAMRPAFRARMETLLGGPPDARVPRAG